MMRKKINVLIKEVRKEERVYDSWQEGGEVGGASEREGMKVEGAGGAGGVTGSMSSGLTRWCLRGWCCSMALTLQVTRRGRGREGAGRKIVKKKEPIEDILKNQMCIICGFSMHL